MPTPTKMEESRMMLLGLSISHCGRHNLHSRCFYFVFRGKSTKHHFFLKEILIELWDVAWWLGIGFLINVELLITRLRKHERFDWSDHGHVNRVR